MITESVEMRGGLGWEVNRTHGSVGSDVLIIYSSEEICKLRVFIDPINGLIFGM